MTIFQVSVLASFTPAGFTQGPLLRLCHFACRLLASYDHLIEVYVGCWSSMSTGKLNGALQDCRERASAGARRQRCGGSRGKWGRKWSENGAEIVPMQTKATGGGAVQTEGTVR